MLSYPIEVEKAFELARSVRQNAYAPYSKYLVGAVLKAAGEERYFTGCNVENASYGGTVCAERVAVFKAVSETPTRPKFDFLMLITDGDPPGLPCGMCLQVLVEFCQSDLPVYVANTRGIQHKYHLKDLMPHPFSF